MNDLVVTTRTGIMICDREGDGWRIGRRGLDGEYVTCAIAREGVVLAGTKTGVYRSDDAGRTWRGASEGLTARHIRSIAYHPDVSDFEFVGTEPAGIFVSHDGGGSWRACAEVAELRDRLGWSLPYSPEAGCIRGFAILGTRAYAAAEAGGVLRSEDSGETWQLVEGSFHNENVGDLPDYQVDLDVHSVSVHPWSRDVVLAATGAGLYRSTDGGKVWDLLYECYCRAAWQSSDDAQTILLGPAGGVDRDGKIEASNDGGMTWVSASAGLKVPWKRTMVERFQQVGEDMLAVLSNGELLHAPIAGWEWKRILPDIQGVTGVCELVA